MASSVPVGNIRAFGLVNFWFDPQSLLGNKSVEQGVAIDGLQVGDHLAVSKPSHTPGLAITNARVSSPGVMQLQTMNFSAGNINATAETWSLLWVRTDGERATHANF